MDILDASILITAHNTYYPIDAVPEFWRWLLHHAEAGRLKVPREMLEEVEAGGRTPGRDLLCDWLRDRDVRNALLLNEDVDPLHVQRVMARAYGRLTEAQIERVGRDPILIAYGLASPDDRCVVTAEVSAPAKTGANRKVPDACGLVGVRSCDPFAFYRRLRFTTAWAPEA